MQPSRVEHQRARRHGGTAAVAWAAGQVLIDIEPLNMGLTSLELDRNPGLHGAGKRLLGKAPAAGEFPKLDYLKLELGREPRHRCPGHGPFL